MSDLFPSIPLTELWAFAACERCGATVAWRYQDRHEQWHRAVDSGTLAMAHGDKR